MAVKKRKKAAGKRLPFGGMTVNFKGRSDSVEKVFGSKALAPSAMTKALWVYVKKNKLLKK